jgi:PAS domain S-box-containing protein
VKTFRSYGLAVASVGLALLATLALTRPGIRGTPFIPAILVSAWYGGIGPGLFAVGLSLLSIDYFIVVPRNSFGPVTVDDGLYLVVFTVSALFVAWLTGAQRRTKASLQKAHDELKARVEDLARAEELTSHVFEATPDAITIVGRDYRCQRANLGAARIFGIPADKAVGMHMAELVDPAGFEQRLKPALDRCFAGEDAGYASWVDTTGLGRRYVAVSYSPLRPTTERVDAALAIARDLTEHTKAWEALREAQVELARVTRVTMLGEITASIAHEVNQPLAAVVMNGDACRRWLAADPPELAEARQAAQRMVKDAERAGHILARIRSLIRRGAPERGALDMNDVIHEAVGFTRAELERQRVAIHTELEADVPAVLGDRVQLQQVLVNLILNARDAMADGSDGSAELTVGSRREAAGGVLVEVKDRGRGIDPAHADRIFEAFFSTKPAGLGMGLSVSRSIVELHGGKIWAARNDGPGVTMRFTLPAAPARG